ncbi:hypothetical protein Smp_37 [Stenotrophomonas phage Smp131]|uniref:Uncharacterized protein n=1 Tax=Stenotrophomonas phage Smp131 TaxID=1168563 RepID=V9IQM8_9CAUD|nr:hypothetical protein CH36_gp38 [Stenotrophomonas phage Smp131]AFJ75507.1 hypothetical protein Smp_37 [Stenotrophomonas phage Smp131]
MAPPNNVTIPEPYLRPVIVLETPIPGLGLRASFDQHKILFLALVHIESDTAATFTAASLTQSFCGLPPGESRLELSSTCSPRARPSASFQWLRTGESYPGGVN